MATTVVFGTVRRSLAAVVAAAAVFTMWAEAAQADDPDRARAEWAPGPEVQISKPRIVRLSADRLLALRAGPSSCVHVGVYGECKYTVYDSAAALVIDVGRGTSTPAASPPEGIELNSFPVAVDGDAFVPAIDHKGGKATEVLLRYASADNRWDVLPLPPGVISFEAGYEQLLAVGKQLVVMHIKTEKAAAPAGQVLGPDGRWRALSPNPLQKEGDTVGFYSADGQILTVRNTKRKALLASLAVSGDGRAASWKKLPPASRPVTSSAAVIGHYLTWVDATYDLRTGRTTQIPHEVRGVTPQIFNNGLVLGHWFTIRGALFNPITRDWFPIPPNKASSRPNSSYPYGPDAQYRVAERVCRTVDGPDNLVQFCDPPEQLYGPTNPVGGVTDRQGPGTTEVLRVSADVTGG